MESRYAWTLVALGGLMGCIAAGAMFCLAIFQEPVAAQTGWSRAGISGAMTLNFVFLGLGSFFWGWLSDRIGTRPVLLAGGVLLGLALVLASRAPSIGLFQVFYGVMVGLGSSAFMAPMISTVIGWFERHRALAVSLVSAGIGMAPLTMSPLSGWLVTHYDWRTGMAAIGILVWVLLVPSSLLVRAAPSASSGVAPQPAGGARGEAARALRSPQFIVLALTFSACCAAHAGPIFHMVSYATLCGLAPMTAVSVYSVEGLAGLGGRVLFGVLADRFGAKRILIGGLLVQAIAIAMYVYVNRLAEFYAMALIFGAAYGGVMPLYAVLARDYFSQQVMGTVLGAATMLSAIGMAAGPLGGGWIYDHFGSYTWMFFGSALIGFGAAAIALAFPRAQARAQPA